MTRLKKKRKEMKLRLREVAAALKITPQGVHYQEKKGIIRKDTAQAYATVFQCDWKDLID